MAARRISKEESAARRAKSRKPSKSSSKRSSSNNNVTIGGVTYANPTAEFVAKKQAELKAKTASSSGGVTSRRVVQGGGIFEVRSDGTFERVALTGGEQKRRARIKSGGALGRDLIPRLNSNQTQAQRGRKIITRLGEAQKARSRLGPRASLAQPRLSAQKQDLGKLANALGVNFKPKQTISQNFAKYQNLKKINTNKSNLTTAEVNRLSNLADKINKRGEKLDSDERAALLAIKSKLRKIKQKSDILLDKLPPSIAKLAKLGTSASVKLNQKLSEIAIGTGSIGSRLAQVTDKILFAGEVGYRSAKRKEFRAFIRRGVSESGRVSQDVQAALRSAFKDPSTYVFAFMGARTSPKSPIPNNAKIVEINVPKSQSPTATVLKNTVIKDKKTGRSYYVDKKANVFSVKTIKGETVLRKTGQPKIKKPAYEQLGFQNQKQFNQWNKLNEQSRNAVGKKLDKVNKKIAKIENTIVSSKNKVALTKIKNLQKNLKKARTARTRKTDIFKSVIKTVKNIKIKGKLTKATKKPFIRKVKSKARAPKTRISKAAERRSTLAKQKKAKADITKSKLKKQGYESLREKKFVETQGFKSKKEFTQFETLFKKSQAGNKRAKASLDKIITKVRKRLAKKGKFQVVLRRFKGETRTELVFRKAKPKKNKAAIAKRKATLKLKSKIQQARLQKRVKKVSKKIIKPTNLKVIQNKYVDNILQSIKADGYYRYDKDYPVITIHSKFKKGTKQYNQILKHELTHHKTRKIFNEGKLAKKIGKIDRKIPYKVRPSEIIARGGEILPARFFKIKGKSITTSKYTKSIPPKNIVKTIIEKAKIRGKRAQQTFSIDQTLLLIKKLQKQPSLKVRSKLKLRVLEKGKISFRIIPRKVVIGILSAKTLNQLKQVQFVPNDITLAYQSALDNAIKSMIKDITAQLPKEKLASISKIGIREVNLLKTQPKSTPRRPARGRQTVKKPIEPIKPKLPKLPKFKVPQSVPNPKGFDAYVKSKTKWIKVNPKPLTKANASKLARYVSNNSLSASHVVVGVKTKAIKRAVNLNANKSFFRASKSKTVPKGTRIEKRSKRLNTIGEKRKLSASRAVSLVRAKLKPKKRAKKKVVKRKTTKKRVVRKKRK